MTHDTDALVSELWECATREIEQRSWTGWHSDHPAMKAADAITRLTRELGEARTESLTNFIAAGQAARLAETAEAALSAARAELAATKALDDAMRDVAADRDAAKARADKFMWQVRDTCVRAEKAEADLAAEKRLTQELENALALERAELRALKEARE